MRKGNIALLLGGTVVAAVILLVLLNSIVTPMTDYTGEGGELMNLTGLGYLHPSAPQFDNVEVYNDTNCTTNQLVENNDFIVDKPYNGAMSGGAESVSGGTLGGNTLDTGNDGVVEITNSEKVAQMSGNFTIIGWVNPSNL